MTDDPDALHGTPTYLAAGDQDPFAETTATLAAALADGDATVVHNTGPGRHNGLYFDEQIPKAVAWIADRCEQPQG